MAFSYDDLKRAFSGNSQMKKIAPEMKRSKYAGIPNSAMLEMLGQEGGMSGDLAASMQAKTDAYRHQIPSAEAEADRLSAGVSARTPEGLRQEMGQRLGADFSNVRFHSDSGSVGRAGHMGARAWTQGNDIYFGQGGFDSDVAAHELVHTVQQGAVAGTSGAVSQSVPMGTAQMRPWWFHFTPGGMKEGKRKNAEKNADRMFQIMAGLSTGSKDLVTEEDKAWLTKMLSGDSQTLVETLLERRENAAGDLVNERMPMEFNQFAPHGPEEYMRNNFKAKGSGYYYNMYIYDQLIKKMQKYSNKEKFKAAEEAHAKDMRDSGAKDSRLPAAQMLTMIPEGMNVVTRQMKDEMRRGFIQRGAYIYRNFFKDSGDPNRPGIFDSYLEQNENSGRNAPPQKAPELRPYEIDMDKARKKGTEYNPTGAEDLRKFNEDLELTDSPDAAYAMFSGYVGSPRGLGKFLDENGDPVWDIPNFNLGEFKKKLKNMARVVHDYPELKGMIGDMGLIDSSKPKNKHKMMSAGSTQGKRRAADLHYNADYDLNTEEGIEGRRQHREGQIKEGRKAFNAANMEYNGSHELGHVLNSLLFEKYSPDDADSDWSEQREADSIVKKVVGRTLPMKQALHLKRYKKDKKYKDKNGTLRGQLDTEASKLNKLGLTSGYGETVSAEFFAEAFADVYEHGKKARPASIELVKEYERRRDKNNRDRGNRRRR